MKNPSPAPAEADDDQDDDGGRLTPEQRELAAKNFKLVPFMVRRYWDGQAKDPSVMDALVSAGSLGLAKAARSYRPEVTMPDGQVRRIKFSTWACRLIFQHVCNEVRKSAKLGFRCGPEAPPKMISLDGRRAGGGPLGGTIEDRPHPEDGGPARDDARLVDRLIAGLEPRERLVIRELFFGGASAPEVGAQLGISKERVRQVKVEAMRKMRSLHGGNRAWA